MANQCGGDVFIKTVPDNRRGETGFLANARRLRGENTGSR